MDYLNTLEIMRKLIFANEVANARVEKLVIFVNCPKVFSMDADGEVYFEYFARDPKNLSITSEVEIPNNLIKQWNEKIYSAPH